MIEIVVTTVTILAGVVTLLSYFSKEKVRVTVCCTESTLLTQKPKIPGITVFVQYEDTILVENLWRICYTLENTGNKNIIGEGAQSSLVVKGGGLPLYTRNIKKMIQLSATENNMVGVSRGHYNMMLLAGIMEILSATIKEMRVGPSQSVYRNRLQTITSCVLSNQKVVNVVCNKSEDMVRYV